MLNKEELQKVLDKHGVSEDLVVSIIADKDLSELEEEGRTLRNNDQEVPTDRGVDGVVLEIGWIERDRELS